MPRRMSELDLFATRLRAQRIPRRMRSMLAFTALEALQQATLWQIEGQRAKYL